ncbi:hypothetical protein ACFSO7_07665 [Bacillus sp. CGMCC 1.16607]
MSNKNPIEFTGNVLDQRNTLTGPNDSNKDDYPKQPQRVTIKEEGSKTH